MAECRVWTHVGQGADMCFLKSSRIRDVVSVGSTSGECTQFEPEVITTTEPRRDETTRQPNRAEAEDPIPTIDDEGSTESEEPRVEDDTEKDDTEEDDTEEDDTEEVDTEEPRGEETTAEASLARAEETIQNCCPDSRRILMIGESGVGKSTLGNRLLGNKNGTCSSLFDDEGQEILQFGVGHSGNSETSLTSWIAGNYFGHEGKCITIIDTPGLGDTLGRDCTNAMNTAAFVKSLNSIHAFVLVIKGSTTRMTPELKEHISRFLEMFGQDFWKRVVIEITFWSHGRRAVRDRKKNRGGLDEKKLTRDLNNMMAAEFKTQIPQIPVVFVDPVYESAFADRREREANDKETQALWKFIDEGDPFICGDFCKAPDSLTGIPTLVDDREMLKRAGSFASISWTIIFGSCNDAAIKSYSLYKDGAEVFSMDATSGRSQELEGFPQNAEIRDHCSTNEEESCSGVQSQMKVITLQFSDIAEDGFGKYSIHNGKGSTRNATLKQIVDGTQSEWSSFSPCTKTCLPEDGIWGSMKRTRVCTPPENGGLPCDGDEEEVRRCAGVSTNALPKSCAGKPGEWGPWGACSKTCGNGTRERTRECLGGVACPKEATKDIGACNPEACPVESTYSDWSSWKCRETCFIPGPEKLDTTEFRNRNCTDGEPKHPTINCDNMVEVYEEEKGCNTVPECPPMNKVTVRVCPEEYSGTNSWVKLWFKTCPNKWDPNCRKKKECLTDWLDADDIIENNWRTGEIMEFFPHQLGRCSRENLRSVSSLWVAAEVVESQTPLLDTFIPYNELALCHISVNFGDTSNKDHSQWDWTGKNKTSLNGPGKGVTSWLELTPTALTPDAPPSNSPTHQRPRQTGREERRGRTRPGT